MISCEALGIGTPKLLSLEPQDLLEQAYLYQSELSNYYFMNKSNKLSRMLTAVACSHLPAIYKECLWYSLLAYEMDLYLLQQDHKQKQLHRAYRR